MLKFQHFRTLRLETIKLKINSLQKTVKTMHFHFCMIYFGPTVFLHPEWKPRSDVSMKGRTANHDYDQENKIKASRSARP